MKYILIVISLLFSTLNMCAQDIGHIEKQGSWLNIYDQSGRKTRSLSATQGELVGYSSKMFILRNGSWYYIYNPDAHKEKTMSVSSVGDILNVAGETFTSRLGNWIYTWDMSGRKINSRYAH